MASYERLKYQADTRLVFCIEPGNAVTAAPFQHRRLNIHANGLVFPALPNPLAGRTRGSAEILAIQVGRTPCQRFEGCLQKFNFILDILHRQLVELVNVSLLGHRWFLVCGFRTHAGIPFLLFIIQSSGRAL